MTQMHYKTLLSRKEPYGANKSIKCFSGYSDQDDIKLLSMRLPQMTGYFKSFDRNKTMSLKINDKKMLKKRIKIRKNVSSLVDKKFDSKAVYGDSDKQIKKKNYTRVMKIQVFKVKKYQKKMLHLNVSH